MLIVAVARASSEDNECYVMPVLLSVLWMTSFSHNGVGNIDASDVLQQVVIHF